MTADWLYQVADAPTVEDCRNEIRRAAEIAERIAKKKAAVQFSAELARLAQAGKQFEAETATIRADLARAEPAPAKNAKPIVPSKRTCERLKQHYLAIRRIKREILLKSPEIDFHELLFAEVPYPQGPQNVHESRSRSVMCAAEGGRLSILEEAPSRRQTTATGPRRRTIGRPLPPGPVVRRQAGGVLHEAE